MADTKTPLDPPNALVRIDADARTKPYGSAAGGMGALGAVRQGLTARELCSAIRTTHEPWDCERSDDVAGRYHASPLASMSVTSFLLLKKCFARQA